MLEVKFKPNLISQNRLIRWDLHFIYIIWNCPIELWSSNIIWNIVNSEYFHNLHPVHLDLFGLSMCILDWVYIIIAHGI